MPTELISGIWIGNIYDLFINDFINDNLIDIIINCTEDIGFPNIPNIQKVRIPFSKNKTNFQLLKDNQKNILDFLNQNIENKNIFIICYNGISISPLIVALYIKEYYHIDNKNIIDSFKSKNKDIFIDQIIINF